jgi:uncharacterized protein YdaU (DUF1376 family)
MPNNKNNGKPAVLEIRMHVGDTLRDMLDLTAEERGVYMSLQLAYVNNVGPLPNDKLALNRMAGAATRSEKRAVDTVLSKKFELSEGGHWRKTALDDELARIAKAREQKRFAGQERQRQQRNQKAADVEQTLNTCSTDAQLNQEPTSKEPKAKKVDVSNTTDTAISPPSPSLEGREEEKLGSVPAPDGAASTTTSLLPSTQPPNAQPMKGIVGGVITAEYGRDLEARLAREAEERANTQARLRGQPAH